MVRKIKSKKKAKTKKQLKKLKENIVSKMNMFDRMPDFCSVCKKTFEKTKETVAKWRVHVYNEEKKVLLCCPDCWEIVEKRVTEETDERKDPDKAVP